MTNKPKRSGELALYLFLQRKHCKNEADKALFKIWWSEQYDEIIEKYKEKL